MKEAIEVIKILRQDLWQLAGLLRREPELHKAAMKRLEAVDEFLRKHEQPERGGEK